MDKDTNPPLRRAAKGRRLTFRRFLGILVAIAMVYSVVFWTAAIAGGGIVVGTDSSIPAAVPLPIATSVPAQKPELNVRAVNAELLPLVRSSDAKDVSLITEAPAPATVLAPTPEPTPAPIPSRYESISPTAAEQELMARVVHCEADKVGFSAEEIAAGKQAVVEVILNRVLDDNFPDTIEEVIYQKYNGYWQFSSVPVFYREELSDSDWAAVTSVLNGTYALPDRLEDGRRVVFFSIGAENKFVATKIGSHTFCYGYKWG